jgi:hypothetical protein
VKTDVCPTHFPYAGSQLDWLPRYRLMSFTTCVTYINQRVPKGVPCRLPLEHISYVCLASHPLHICYALPNGCSIGPVQAQAPDPARRAVRSFCPTVLYSAVYGTGVYSTLNALQTLYCQIFHFQ